MTRPNMKKKMYTPADLISIITVFSARIYGSRAKVFRKKINKVIDECKKNS